ncbi:hypothetical protein [uncultured Methylobacterium sp.]|uniref:hypothetical protein n=1 Tax=uncultured Methylobacterium sp. TaxID=157278 RepID=UPI0035CA6207
MPRQFRRPHGLVENECAGDEVCEEEKGKAHAREDTRRSAVVEVSVGRYSAVMTNLDTLLDRLKARQRDLIMEAAQSDTLPADSTLKRISELENAIAAVEAVADEEAKEPRAP